MNLSLGRSTVQPRMESGRMAVFARPGSLRKDCVGTFRRMTYAGMVVRPGAVTRQRVVLVTAKSGDSADDGQIYDAVIVGAGISGLVAAQALHTRHSDSVPNILVTEARDRVGGNITSRSSEDGYRWEEGPNSFQPNDAMLEVAVDTGIEKDLVLGDPTAPRFVYWDKKLRATPSSPLSAVTFDLLTIFGKIRAGLGAIGLGNRPPPDGVEETVEQFIRRNLGDEVFYRLIEPFCSGVYAGDPSKLSMKGAFGKIWDLEQKGGSLVGGALELMKERKANPPPPRDPRLPPKPSGQTVGSFQEGLKMVPEAILKSIPDRVRTSWELQKLERDAAGAYRLTYATPDGRKRISARTVALTAPAYVVAKLLAAEFPDAASALDSIDYPPVAAVTLAYPESAVRDDRKDKDGNVPGFGQLHPRSQGVTTLGTIYSSSLFPNRAPPGQMLVLNYIGGATNRGILDQSEQELVTQVDTDLRGMLLKPDAPEPKVVGVRVWPRAIPQANVGVQDKVAACKEALRAKGWDGVLLGGNYVCGVALGKCVEAGYTFADDIQAACSRSSPVGKDEPVAAA